MKRVLSGVVVATLVGLMSPGAAFAAGPATRVVDDDGVQCANAAFRSIGAAVAAANPGDTVRVCPGVYRERVDVGKPLRVVGQPDAIATVKCVAEAWSSTDTVDPTMFPVLEPPDGEVASLLRLQADGIEVAGLVVQGQADSVGPDIYAPAIQADAAYGGHWIHHSLIQNNTLGVELGSNGTVLSRVDHNCLRGNDWAVANQRYATSNVRVDHNEAFRTRYIPFEVGTPAGGSDPRFIRDARFDHNQSVESGFAAYLVQRAQSVRLDHNTVEGATQTGVDIRGENSDITVTDNRLTGTSTTAGAGVGVLAPFENVPQPSLRIVIAKNVIRSFAYGVRLGPNAQNSGTQILDNLTESNRAVGILIGQSNTKALVQGNVANNNLYGIRTGVAPVRDNTFVGNSMHSNSATDAFELNFETQPDGSITLSNTWQNNRCDTDSPSGTICGR